MAISGVAHPQGGRPAAVFYLFGHPTPYAYVHSPDFEALTKRFLKHVLIEKFIGNENVAAFSNT
jgi:hypothetical protein